jgi:hypothetical protein
VLGEDIEQQKEKEKSRDDNQALYICDFSGEIETSVSKDSENNPSK